MASTTAARSTEALRRAFRERVLVADGAMGTMLQEYDLTLDDFEGHEGCNEILNVTRPDVVRGIHDAYFSAGVDFVETNTFGANHAALGEYDIIDKIYELAEAGCRLAREVADDHSTADKPRYILGSMGPGTKLPSLGHLPYATLRDGYQTAVAGMIAGGADALIVETTQDLLQTKASILGAKRAMASAGVELPIVASVTVETTGTMLLGSEIGAALTALEPLGVDVIGLNCATGPAEMSEHLRYLSQHARIPVSCMPNAGLPVLTSDGAHYPLTAPELAEAHGQFVNEFGLSLVGGCCGTGPEHMRQVVEQVGREVVPREITVEPSTSSIYQSVPFRQESSYLAVGERTNANGSKAFREAMVDERWDDIAEIARGQIRDGSHMLDLCVDYVGRDGVADMKEIASRLATASTLPIMLDSTEPPVIEAGLELLGGRCVVNSVNFEDGEGPDTRFATMVPLIREHGAGVVVMCIDEEGQARTADNKVAIALRIIDRLVEEGIEESAIMVDTLTFTLGTGQEESRQDGIQTIEAIRKLKQVRPDVQTVLGLSNISFGLNPAARQVVNSVFLHECTQAGLDAAIVHASKILPMNRIPEEQRQTALDLVHDRRSEGYDPLQELLHMFAGVKAEDAKASRAEELAALSLSDRLQRRIIDGESNGLHDDLDDALGGGQTALEIINQELLGGMKVVGELFGKGEMQLPFVLQSAETMKTAVAHLEPHIEKSEDDAGKGTIVLATVKGDVHDIGKNLVDIILTNNGYSVVNLGIKQPINTILDAAEEHSADVIGMSGLLVKSTVIMKENLEEMNGRGDDTKRPVLLGGAALTRAFVEEDLGDMYEGEVRYAKDAFEGLSLMDTVMAIKRGEPGAELPERRKRKVAAAKLEETPPDQMPERSDVAGDNPVPEPPFFGDRVVKGIQLADYASMIDERALFLGQWGLKPAKGKDGPSYEELIETEGRPRLRAILDRVQTEGLLEAGVVYGYFPAVSKGDDLIVLDDAGNERTRFTFPRQRRDGHLCLADYWRREDSGEVDVVGFTVATIGNRISEETNRLFEGNHYREYLELHGVSVQLAEALAEYWHARMRSELGVADEDQTDDIQNMIHKLGYRGARFSLGYGACPDLEDRAKIVSLLDPSRIGVELSDEFQLHPEQSTDAVVVHHPEAKYFNT